MLAEDCPRIRIALLKREGLFESRNSEKRLWSLGCGQQRFLIRADESRRELLVYWQGETEGAQAVEIEWVQLRFGRRPYFVCPGTGERCLDLYLSRNILASREAHGLALASKRGSPGTRWRMRVERVSDHLLGRDGKPQARGSKRSRLVDEMRALSVGYLDKEVQNVVAAEEVRRRRARRRPYRSHRHAGPMSTAAAFAYSESGVSFGSALAWMEPTLARAAAEGPTRPASEQEQRPVRILEEFAALDMRALNRIWPDQEKLWVAGLRWPAPAMCGAERIVFAVDVRNDASPILLVRSVFSQAPPVEQVIELRPAHPGAPPRWFLVCPVTGQKCDILFLRDGYFASAKAQRLVHRSQRAAGRLGGTD